MLSRDKTGGALLLLAAGIIAQETLAHFVSKFWDWFGELWTSNGTGAVSVGQHAGLGWSDFLAVVLAVSGLALVTRSWWQDAAIVAKLRGVWTDGRIGYTEASCLLYEKASEPLRQTIQDMEKKGLCSIVGWGKAALLDQALNGQCVMYARRAPGLPHERIPASELRSMHPEESDTLKQLQGETRFFDVVFDRADVIRALGRYEGN